MLTRHLTPVALLPALVALGCASIGEDESAVNLAISAADTTLVAESIEVEVTDLDSGLVTSDSYTDLGGWPVDPTEHTVLLVADTPDDTERRAEVRVTACDSATTCTPLADGVVALIFTPGEVADESVTLE
jgi:hypothetical protein